VQPLQLQCQTTSYMSQCKDSLMLQADTPVCLRGTASRCLRALSSSSPVHTYMR